MDETTLILDFIDQFKKQDYYQEYLLAEKRLSNVSDLLNKYKEYKEQYHENQYLKNDKQFMKKWKEINNEFNNNEIITHYYQCYYQVTNELNRLLNLIFKDIVVIKQF